MSVKKKILLYAGISIVVLLSHNACGSGKLLDYGFYVDWPERQNALKQCEQLPFVIQLQSSRPYFLLAYQISKDNSAQVFFNRIEITKGKKLIGVRSVRSHFLPVEWPFEPVLLTNRTMHVAIDFHVMEAPLLEQFGRGSYQCRIKLPIWKVDPATSHFVIANYIKSSWFTVDVEERGVSNITASVNSFSISGDQTLKDYSDMKSNPGYLFVSPL